jgi:hypothetical protein
MTNTVPDSSFQVQEQIKMSCLEQVFLDHPFPNAGEYGASQTRWFKYSTDSLKVCHSDITQDGRSPIRKPVSGSSCASYFS